MKNLILELLIAIAFFVYFCGVTFSAGIHGESSSRPPSHSPAPYVNSIVIEFFGVLIDVVRTSIGDVHLPNTCTIRERPGHPKFPGVPSRKTKKAYNFTTLPIFHKDDGIRYCVAYITVKGNLLGVQAPPKEDNSTPDRYNGEPKNLSPDALRYFITYLGWDFVVYHDPKDRLEVIDVKLFYKNKANNEFFANSITKFQIGVEEIHYPGVPFFAARRRKPDPQRPPLTDNSFVIFEAAWYHAKDICPLLLKKVPGEQIEAWFRPKKKRRSQ